MRCIIINPYDRTITEADYDGSLGHMRSLLNDGPCMVRFDDREVLWVGDNGLLTEGLPVFRFIGTPHKLAGVGVCLGLDEGGYDIATEQEIADLERIVAWTDLETTGELEPTREYVRDDGAHVTQLGEGILRERKQRR